MRRSYRLLSRTGLFVTIALTLFACTPVTPGALRPPLPPASGLLSPETVASAENAAPENFSPAAAPQQPTVVILPTPTPQPPDPPETLDGPVTVAIDPAIPEDLAAPIHVALARTQQVNAANGPQPLLLIDQPENASAVIRLGLANAPGVALADRYLAVVAPFDTISDDIALVDLQARWQGSAPVYASEEAARLLSLLWGAGAAQAVPLDQMSGLLEADRNALGIVAFEQIDPRFKVLTLDGANVLSNNLQAGQYPLIVQAKVDGVGATLVAPALQGAIQYGTNRDPSQLTTLIMTGVTAMARGTAARMEQKGYTYPAEIIGPTLAAADITHVSNEIPFLDDCRVNNTENNLVLCSDTTYWATLEAIGTDIVGLSGNHVNDFGRDGARRSLQWYKDNQIPIYGSGLTIDEACAPLLWEHNGNTFAFIAALAFDPPGAWVTETEPGACYFYDHKERIINTISDLKDKVDIVAVELQYVETYFPYPTADQVVEFRELRAAGADIVTGVQSHVPQAQEPYGAFDAGGPGMISYGLGNLFFDQMWSWATRTELMARHAIYNGKLLNTEILTAVLEDYAQPRWTTAAERADLLSTIFGGAPPRP